MKLHDPDNRLGKPVPFAETAEDFTLESAKDASRNCEKCGGEGAAPIYNPKYRGDAVEERMYADTGKRQVLFRATAFCICPAGRKIAVLCQQTSKDVFLRTPDYHDVVAGKYRWWQTDDPTENDAPTFDVTQFPESFQRLLDKTRPRIYHEPREEINRMFDDQDEAI